MSVLSSLYFVFLIISEPIPLYYKSHFKWQHKSRGSISSDISAGKEVKTRSQEFNLKRDYVYSIRGKNIAAYSLVFISVFVDVSTLYRSLDSRVRRMRINREKLR
jgi:hypothetical protein